MPTEYNIVLENLTFIKCKAIYGGAVYIYCNQPSSINIKYCYFNQNEATRRPPSVGDYLFGGSACYLHVKNSNIIDSFFDKNIGSSVKLNDVFDDSASRILMSKDSDSSISINGCYFKIDSISSSSLFLVRGMNKYETPIEVKNCTFTGDLSKGAHHIDGTSHLDDKKNNKESNIKIESCKFSSGIENAVNLKKHPKLFASFDSDLQLFNVNETIESELINDVSSPNKINNNNNRKSSIYVISITMTFVFAILITVSLVILKRNNSSQEDSLDTEDIFEIKNDL